MSASEPRWLGRLQVDVAHVETVREHGGLHGVRDENLLESALARPQQLACYGQPDVADLAAAYGCGIARNHPFIDGNKRTAFVAVELFLRLNGQALQAQDSECVLTMLTVADGSLSEPAFATWLRLHTVPRGEQAPKR